MPGCTGISVAGIGLAEENTCAQDMFRLNIELPWCLHNWKVLHLHLSYPCYLGAMSIGDRMQLPCTAVSMNDMRASTVHAHLLPIVWAPQRRSFNDVRSDRNNVPGMQSAELCLQLRWRT